MSESEIGDAFVDIVLTGSTMAEINRLRREAQRLRAALEQCAAAFDSGPCTVFDGYALAAAELQRRMEIAGNALI